MRNENILLQYGAMIRGRAIARTLAGLGTVALVCLVLATGSARAQPGPLVLGALFHVGSGCPAGTANATLGASGHAIHFGFDAFTVKASLVPPPPDCFVHVPITVPPGVRLRLRTIRGRGNATIPRGGQGAVRGHFRLGSCEQVNFYHSVSGPSAGTFVFTKSGTACQTPCGMNTSLRGRITITAQNPPSPPIDAELTLKNAGVALELVRC